MSTQNSDDGCPSALNVIKKAAKDRKRCSLRKGKLRKRHLSRTIRTGKPIIPPKPRLPSSGRSIPPSKPGKPPVPPKPCLSKSKAERPIIAPKPRMPTCVPEKAIIRSKPQPSHALETNIRPMPPVTQMCPIAVLTPMGFLIPRNFPSAILVSQAVTFGEHEQIHPDDPVQIGLGDPVAQTHDSPKRTNDGSTFDEIPGQLTDLFTSMCQIQESSEVSDHIEAEDFGFFNVFKHTKDSAVMRNPRLALALKNILLEMQVIQSEAPEMMEMLKNKTGGNKEYKRGERAISGWPRAANNADESNDFSFPSTGSRMDIYRKYFAQHSDPSHRSESPKPWKSNVSPSGVKTAQKTEREVAEATKISKERVLEKNIEGIKCTEIEKASCTPKRPSYSEQSSSEESRTNRKDMGSSVAEKIISFSQLIQERTHDAVEANVRTSDSRATCSYVTDRKESNKSNGSKHRPARNVEIGEKEKGERQFAVFSNNNSTFMNADPSSSHNGNIEKFTRPLNPESEIRVKRTDVVAKLVGKEDCSESKQASGNSTEASPRESHAKSHEVHERTRAVVEDLKKRLSKTQDSATIVAQERAMDNWDSFDSSSSSLNDEHIYEEIDEMSEMFGTKTSENLSSHSKFSAMSNYKNAPYIANEKVLVRTPELTTASVYRLAQASGQEVQEAVRMSTVEAGRSKRKVQEERRDAKDGHLRSIIKGNNVVTTKIEREQWPGTSHQSDTSVDSSSEEEESKHFCFVIGF